MCYEQAVTNYIYCDRQISCKSSIIERKIIMNKVILSGRLTADPYTNIVGETSVTTFTVAVRRNYKNKNGEYESDFIRCEAWGKTGKTIEEYFTKGSAIELIGSWLTGNYEKDGNLVFTNIMLVESFSFALTTKSLENNQQTHNSRQSFSTKQSYKRR